MKIFPGQSSIREIDTPFIRLKHNFKNFQESQHPKKDHNLFSLNRIKRNSLLHKAVEEGDELLTWFLINAGLDINRQNFWDETLLYIACVKKKEALVKLLLDFEASR